MKIELSQFEYDFNHDGKKEVFRFDFYNTTDTEVNWKKPGGGRYLPNFDIDFSSYELAVVCEKKPSKDKDGKKVELMYHPGFEFKFTTLRNPKVFMVKAGVPAFLLGLLLIITHTVEMERINKRVEIIGVVLLAYVELYGLVHDNVPDITSVPIGEKYVMMFTIVSLLPCGYLWADTINDESRRDKVRDVLDSICFGFALTVYIVAGVILLIQVTRARKKLG